MPELPRERLDELRRKVEELAGLAEMFYELMMALDKAKADPRASGGGEDA